MIHKKRLVELVKYKFKEIKYYINIIDCEDFSTDMEKDYPFNINGKIIFFDEVSFRKLLGNYIDIDNDTTDELVDTIYDINFLKDVLGTGGYDEERLIIATLNLMQDALLIWDLDWKSKYTEFMNMANYFTFNSSVDKFLEKYPTRILNLINELVIIDQLINDNSILISCNNDFVKLPFEPVFF
jgi:hypothetical protein